MKLPTKAIHIGQKPDKETGAIIPPIYMTSTYMQESPGCFKGYDYTRAGNPNFTNLEQTLASLENASYATVFSSGLGSTTGLLGSLLQQGDAIVVGNDLYGGTVRLLHQFFKKYGITIITIDTSNLNEVEDSLKNTPKAILFESPSNPLLKLSDIAEISKLAKASNVITIADNTFATPCFQNPIDMGVDVVFHSTTKYLGGHSDTVGGVVMTNDKELKEKLDFARMSIGLNPSPFDVWLISRGVKTLAVRMQQHEKNAQTIADYLSSHKMVKKVYYPGLASNPQYALARKQMSGFGGMVSVEFDMSIDETTKLISSFRLIALAESLGGIESLVNHPATMTHASIPREDRLKNGLTDGLVRFSVGIEDVNDLLTDMDRQLKLI